jgi:hypothetical protein
MERVQNLNPLVLVFRGGGSIIFFDYEQYAWRNMQRFVSLFVWLVADGWC